MLVMLTASKLLDAIVLEIKSSPKLSKETSLLDLETLERIISSVESGKGGQLVFRHGEQDPGPEIAAYNEATKKIIMMQAEHNKQDPITLNSALEWVGTLLTLAYIQA